MCDRSRVSGYFFWARVDFTKLGWRALNQRDEFPQMICWLSRREKIAIFEMHQKSAHSATPSTTTLPPKKTPAISIAKHPKYPGRDIATIQDKHNAPDFEFYLKQFFNNFTETLLGPRQTDCLNRTPLSFQKVDVYDMFCFHPEELQDEEDEKDLVKAIGKSAKFPHGRFDTVVVYVRDDGESTGVADCVPVDVPELTSMLQCPGTRVGRVKVIFSLPKKLDTRFGPRDLPSTWPQGPLAYVEWYTLLAQVAEERNGIMYRIKIPPQNQQKRRLGAVIPLGNICQSCMLFPAYHGGREVLSDWNHENVLDKATSFYLNNWLSKYSYQTLY
ncbi:hypothetical protein CVT26_016215 [Gymnopilus dilepis]|uniref:DUF6830 domain-containing protein n=1 Tax=Gymnopilus dilepis TaxID=231916 RepID=A0A409X927_9AGAR|nr:hypothetical protein CVT26_016215 [Gymnopilus dilepis]